MSHKLSSPKMAISEWRDKIIIIYSHNGILESSENKWTTATQIILDNLSVKMWNSGIRKVPKTHIIDDTLYGIWNKLNFIH